MPVSDPILWDKVATWPLPHRRETDKDAEPPRTCASFEDCLRKKGDWTDESARRITEGYRRFLYLKALSGEPITPSQAIDMAWHLHLSFPADYAALCKALGRDVPHLTGLSPDEQAQAYDRGLALYAAEFDRAPHVDLWPSRENLSRARFLFLVTYVALFGSVGLWWTIGGLRGFLIACAFFLPLVLVRVHLEKRWDLGPGARVIPPVIPRCG
jgi:hypothetical protein